MSQAMRLAHRPHLRALDRAHRQEGRIGIDLVEIFEDRRRLDEHGAADIEGRHPMLRVDRAVGGARAARPSEG